MKSKVFELGLLFRSELLWEPILGRQAKGQAGRHASRPKEGRQAKGQAGDLLSCCWGSELQ
jgi:hypothetical protein